MKNIVNYYLSLIQNNNSLFFNDIENLIKQQIEKTNQLELINITIDKKTVVKNKNNMSTHIECYINNIATAINLKLNSPRLKLIDYKISEKNLNLSFESKANCDTDKTSFYENNIFFDFNFDYLNKKSFIIIKSLLLANISKTYVIFNSENNIVCLKNAFDGYNIELRDDQINIKTREPESNDLIFIKNSLNFNSRNFLNMIFLNNNKFENDFLLNHKLISDIDLQSTPKNVIIDIDKLFLSRPKIICSLNL